MGGHVCASKNCKNSRTRSKESFFSFPKDVRRARVWAVACGREDLLGKLENLHNSHRLCGAHFENRMFLNDLRNRLQPHAVPTVFPSLEGSSKECDHSYASLMSGTPYQLVGSDSTRERKRALESVHLPLSREHSPDEARRVELTEDERPSKIKILEDTVILPGHTARDPPASLELNTPESNAPEDIVSDLLLSPSSSTQTFQQLSAHTPRKEKLRTKIKYYQNENIKLKRKIAALETRLGNISDEITLEDYKNLTYKFCTSQQLAQFINIQVSQSQKRPKGRRYSSEFKNECLSMYFTGPKLYRTKLSKQFCLPGPKTLLRYIKHIKIQPGMNDAVLQTIKMKTDNFQAEDKLCVLCFDEMSIKANLFYNRTADEVIGFEDCGDGEKLFTPALNAMVLMVKGIRNKWKQPISFYFHHSSCPAEKLKDIIFECVTKLKEAGLQVCVVVSDMGSKYLELTRLLNVSPETPYFDVGEQKVIYMFDTPHLIKATRNNLMKHKLVFQENQTSWQHIKKLYEHDKEYNTRACPKLTDSHIQPSNFEKMKVKFAVQVLSASVSAAMNLCITFGFLPAQAAATSTFIERMNNLFDILNSSVTSKADKFNRAFKGLDYQTNFLKDCSTFFNNLKVFTHSDKDITKKIKFAKCWQVTINGFLQLWDILKLKNFDYILTRRINQDALENFFGSIRQQNGNCINPTPIQFIRSFKKLLCLNLIHSGTENCEGDTEKVLLKVTDLQTEEISVTEEERLEIEKIPVINLDYESSDILEQNFTRYICGYLINKCLSKHTCDVCAAYAKKHEELDDSSLLCFFKAYDNAAMDTFGNLTMPSDDFVYFISSLEKTFDNNFEDIITQKFVMEKFITLYKVFLYQHPCPNFPYEYVLRLYGRLRLYCTLKFINRNFKKINTNKMIIWKHQ